MKKLCIKSLILLGGLLFTSCNTLDKNKSVQERIDYSDEDIVQIEIDKIKGLQSTEPVRALWRAVLLGNEDIKQDCQNNVYLLYNQAVEEKDYLTASRLFTSLKTAGYVFDENAEKLIEDFYKNDVPGFTDISDKKVNSIADCMNATVTIWVDRGLKIQNGSGFQDVVIGSGFFIDKRGYVVTNHHVIDSMVDSKYEGYSRLYVKLLSDIDTKIPAKVVGYDPILDLALLKVEIVPEFVLALGSSQSLKIGDKVSVIGTPLGLEGTLTSGIISSVDRKLMTLGKVFQLDAAVNSGNSGGPMLDENLDVQAIIFAGVPQYQGLNFAIPVEYLRKELYALYDGNEFLHPWLGAYGHTKRNGNKRIGLEVQYVMPGGSAFMSGLQAGDVITEVDGNKIASIDDFQYLFMGYQCETLLKCKYLDNDENECETYIYLERRPEAPLKEIYKRDFVADAFVPIFGMQLIHSSTTSHKSYKIEKIIKGTVADEMSFSENDSIIVKDVKFDDENKAFYAQITTQRRKKDILDLTMVLGSSYDNPYYF